MIVIHIGILINVPCIRLSWKGYSFLKIYIGFWIFSDNKLIKLVHNLTVGILL